jgi:hypothetical protein
MDDPTFPLMEELDIPVHILDDIAACGPIGDNMLACMSPSIPSDEDFLLPSPPEIPEADPEPSDDSYDRNDFAHLLDEHMRTIQRHDAEQEMRSRIYTAPLSSDQVMNQLAAIRAETRSKHGQFCDGKSCKKILLGGRKKMAQYSCKINRFQSSMSETKRIQAIMCKVHELSQFGVDIYLEMHHSTGGPAYVYSNMAQTPDGVAENLVKTLKGWKFGNKTVYVHNGFKDKKRTLELLNRCTDSRLVDKRYWNPTKKPRPSRQSIANKSMLDA